MNSPCSGSTLRWSVLLASLLLAPRASADEVVEDPELARPRGKAPRSGGEQIIEDPELSGSRRKPARSGDEEVVEDPELAGAGAERSTGEGEGVIDDPELAGSRGGTSAAAVPSEPSTPVSEWPRPAVFRFGAHTRWGTDLHWVRRSQDVWEGTTIATLEAEQRRSEVFLFSIGARMRYGFAQRRDGATLYQLDLIPTTGYVDVTPSAGYHLRLGYQGVSMGRFDMFTATNFLGVYDLRSGVVTMPEAAAIAQPAVRFDWDEVRGFALQVFYVPFFQQNLTPVYGSDYSPLIDRAIDAGQYGPNAQRVRDAFESALTRSSLANGSIALFHSLAPPPSIRQPQGAIRGTFSGESGEISFTAGTALERFPVIGSTTVDGVIVPQLDFPRFYVGSVDGSLDAGPMQAGFELAYIGHRTLTASRLLDDGTGESVAQQTDLGHLGLRLELVEASGWAAAIEAFAQKTLRNPKQRDADGAPLTPGPPLSWFTMDEGGWWRGISGGVHFEPTDLPLHVELGAMVFSGPTYAFLPRVEVEATEGLFFELGAAIVEGKPAPYLSPRASLGGLFNDVDQVFLGMRWVP